jgi:hypothetical protein
MRSNVNTKLPPPGSLRATTTHHPISSIPNTTATSAAAEGGDNASSAGAIPLDRGIPMDVRAFLEKGLLRYEMKLYADALRHLEHNLHECHM